jgi:hypothetical protein
MHKATYSFWQKLENYYIAQIYDIFLYVAMWKINNCHNVLTGAG